MTLVDFLFLAAIGTLITLMLVAVIIVDHQQKMDRIRQREKRGNRTPRID